MAHICAGRVFCTHVFRQGFGRPHSRARVKEARPLFCCLWCEYSLDDKEIIWLMITKQMGVVV
jgi:hypothetical protein